MIAEICNMNIKKHNGTESFFLSSLHLGGHFGRLSMTRISWVELGERSGRDTLQHFFGEDTEELPANIQRFKHGTVFIITWSRGVVSLKKISCWSTSINL